MESNEGKCRVLHPKHQYTQGADLVDSSSVEENLGVLVGNRFTMSQQRALVAKRAYKGR